VRVAVTGASGLIGSAVVDALRSRGDEVLTLVRREPSGRAEVRWDPAAGTIDAARLDGVEAAIHLAGAGVADKRWTAAYKRTVLESRVSGTTLLAQTLAGLQAKPRVLLSGSAVGYYGDTGDRVEDESGPRGGGFLVDVVERWEASTAAAEQAGIRVCHLRTGIVLTAKGGALKKQLPLFRAGLGGRLGSGKQWQSWISLDDEVGAILFLLGAEQVSGPVNLVAPAPVRQTDFTKALGRALHRPAVAAVPPFALRLALPGFADEGLLIGQRLQPKALQDAGYVFRQPTIDAGLAAALQD